MPGYSDSASGAADFRRHIDTNLMGQVWKGANNG
jgi:hypothetical protein